MTKAIEFVYDSLSKDDICSHQFNKWIREHNREKLDGDTIEIVSIAATTVKSSTGYIDTLFVIYNDYN
jgi:hypothetical protein